MPTRRAGFKPGKDNKRGRGRFYHRRLVCQFCADSSQAIDYKDVHTLRRFLTDRARIAPRRRTGACSKHQGAISIAIKRARHLALLPFSPNHEFPVFRYPSAANKDKPKEIDKKVEDQASVAETVDGTVAPEPVEPTTKSKTAAINDTSSEEQTVDEKVAPEPVEPTTKSKTVATNDTSSEEQTVDEKVAPEPVEPTTKSKTAATNDTSSEENNQEQDVSLAENSPKEAASGDPKIETEEGPKE